MNHNRITIGIDPDVEKNGLAVIVEDRVEVYSLPFWDLLNKVRMIKTEADINDQEVVAYIEASWKTTAVWHLAYKDNKQMAAKKGYGVGRNHQTGMLLAEGLKRMGLKVFEQTPLKKYWNGKDGKISQEEIAAFMNITTVPKKKPTNQEERDAALIAWVCAGKPIKVKPLKR